MKNRLIFAGNIIIWLAVGLFAVYACYSLLPLIFMAFSSPGDFQNSFSRGWPYAILSCIVMFFNFILGLIIVIFSKSIFSGFFRGAAVIMIVSFVSALASYLFKDSLGAFLLFMVYMIEGSAALLLGVALRALYGLIRNIPFIFS